jgi:hypothetical protein
MIRYTIISVPRPATCAAIRKAGSHHFFVGCSIHPQMVSVTEWKSRLPSTNGARVAGSFTIEPSIVSASGSLPRGRPLISPSALA